MINSGFRDNFMLSRQPHTQIEGFRVIFTLNPGFRNQYRLQQ